MSKSSASNYIKQEGKPAKSGLAYHKGLLVPPKQSYVIDERYNNLIRTIPSNTTPAWGGSFNIDIREVGILENIDLYFNVSQLTGMTDTDPNTFVPANLWMDRIEVISLGNGSVLLTHYAEDQHVEPNLFTVNDEERFYLNSAVGRYNDQDHREVLSGKQSYYIPKLWTALKQTTLPIPSAQHGIQLRVYMKQLSSVVETGANTGTPSAPIISCAALCRYTNMPNPTEFLRSIAERPRNYKILDHQHMTVDVNSGLNNTRIALSGINGKISYLWFIVREANPTNGELYDFKEIKDYALVDGGGNNFVGGVPLTDTMSRVVYGNMYTETRYLSENGTHVYLFSFSHDPRSVVNTGNELGSRQFTGSESMILNFESSLTSNVQVSIYATRFSALEVGPSGWRKVGSD